VGHGAVRRPAPRSAARTFRASNARTGLDSARLKIH